MECNDDSKGQTVQDKAVRNKRKKITRLYSKRKKLDSPNVPTAEELNNLREAESMFHSNIFKMQVDELLKELKDKMCKQEELEQWIKNFSKYMWNIPETDTSPIKDFSLDDTVELPIIQSPESDKGNFKFMSPEAVIKIGSYSLGTMCSLTPIVDIAVEIPKACWQSMDFLNHRYHRKRAFYLAYLAQLLLEADFINQMKFNYQNECHLKPVLLITPKGLENITICLSAYPSTEAFKLSRFHPSKNNVRSTWYFGNEEDTDKPTPYYNASVLSDLMIPTLYDYLAENISSQNVKDGIILLKLWCKQRGLTTGYGRLNGFILTMFVAYLLKKGKVTQHMSAYQVFRCALLGFCNNNWVDQQISLCDDPSNCQASQESGGLYDVVFVESSGSLNIAYQVTKQTFLRVQHEAKLGLLILDSESPDSFEKLFMNKITFSNKFDYLLHLNDKKKLNKYLEHIGLQNKMLDFGGNTAACLLPKICSILKIGLKDRVLLIDVTKSPHNPWSISDSPLDPSQGQISIGFLLNPDVPISNIEKGPVANDPEAKTFRDFWGDRSEMRRFQDGTIREEA